MPESVDASRERDRLRAQSLQIALELEDARRVTAKIGRAMGVAVALVGIAFAYAVYEGMRARGIYVAELVFMAAWALVAGALMIVFGAGGAARLGHVPRTMWMAWAGVSAILGLMIFIPLGRLLAHFAGYTGL
jgi:hypothetical protein